VSNIKLKVDSNPWP